MDALDEIAWRVAEGHAYKKHVVVRREFHDPTRGPPVPIETREDFQKHIRDVLLSAETSCCTLLPNTSDEADIFYHTPSNTTVILPKSPQQEPTACRSWRGIHFLIDKCTQDGTESGRRIVFSKSICELRPEFAHLKDTEKDKQADENLRQAVEERFQKERKQMQERHEREVKSARDPHAYAERHATELRNLEEGKQRDLERYRREHEAARQLLEERDRRKQSKELSAEEKPTRKR